MTRINLCMVLGACLLGAGCGAIDHRDGEATGPGSPSLGSAGPGAARILSPSAVTEAETGISSWTIERQGAAYTVLGHDRQGKQIANFEAADPSTCESQQTGTLQIVSHAPAAAVQDIDCTGKTVYSTFGFQTQRIWDRLTSDLSAELHRKSPPSEIATPAYCPPFCCERKTDTKCYGVVLFRNDQYPDPGSGMCVRSGWYACGPCLGFPW